LKPDNPAVTDATPFNVLPVVFIPFLTGRLVLSLVLTKSGELGGGWIICPGITRKQGVTMHNFTSLAFTAFPIIYLLLR
jgi:hypothetical protein